MPNAPKIAPVKQDEIKSQISDAIIRKIELEVAKWVKFVNLSGIITMGLAISCIGTNFHKFTGSASLLFMTIYYLYGRKNFPPTIKELRKQKKEKKLHDIDATKLAEIEASYFGFWKFIFTCLLFLLPILLLIFLAIGAFDDIAKKYETKTEQAVAKFSCIKK